MVLKAFLPYWYTINMFQEIIHNAPRLHINEVVNIISSYNPPETIISQKGRTKGQELPFYKMKLMIVLDSAIKRYSKQGIKNLTIKQLRNLEFMPYLNTNVSNNIAPLYKTRIKRKGNAHLVYPNTPSFLAQATMSVFQFLYVGDNNWVLNQRVSKEVWISVGYFTWIPDRRNKLKIP